MRPRTGPTKGEGVDAGRRRSTPPGTAEIAATLAHAGGQGRSRHHGTLALFRLGLPVAECGSTQRPSLT